jgi:hypothetical protein
VFQNPHRIPDLSRIGRRNFDPVNRNSNLTGENATRRARDRRISLGNSLSAKKRGPKCDMFFVMQAMQSCCKSGAHSCLRCIGR